MCWDRYTLRTIPNLFGSGLIHFLNIEAHYIVVFIHSEYGNQILKYWFKRVMGECNVLKAVVLLNREWRQEINLSTAAVMGHVGYIHFYMYGLEPAMYGTLFIYLFIYLFILVLYGAVTMFLKCLLTIGLCYL
jgi:hypothetical protein